jgi:hypothetical protein
MALTSLASPAQALAAELGAALPAHRAAAEFALHFSQGSEATALKKALGEVRAAEARLESCAPAADDNAASLGRLAAAEAAYLERESGLLNSWLPPQSAGLVHANVRLVASVLWEARYGEGRAKAMLSARRRHLRLPGFDEALDLAPENELLFLALRRFSRLLHSSDGWSLADLEWLRLRASTVPGRFRVHAAKLLSAAEMLAKVPLPEDLEEARRPFLQFGYDPEPALAWGIAGFSVTEALAWGSAGLPWAEQALAWRSRGFEPKEAAQWARAELLPDEAAAFRACGAADPAIARELRTALGDVEQLLVWHRAGFAPAEVLRFRAEGVDVEAAVAQRKGSAKALAAAMLAPDPETVPLPGAVLAMEARTPAPTVTVAKLGPNGAKAKRSAGPAADWSPEGGAWIGWSVFEEGGGDPGSPSAGALSRSLSGGLMDVAVASEGVALPSLPFSAPDLEIEGAWQAELDRHRQALGRSPQPGHWQLMALAPQAAQLYWGLLFKTPSSPWGHAIDFDADETWDKRWKRKAEEFGEAGLPPSCVVGRTPSRGWFIAAPGSLIEHREAQPLALEQVVPQKAWREAVERFCQIMGLGKQAAGWHLVALDPSAA